MKLIYWMVAVILAIPCPTILGMEESEASRIFREAVDAENKNQFQDANSKFQQALELYQKQNDKKGIADSLYRLGCTNNVLSRYKESIQVLEKAQNFHTELNDHKAAAFDNTELAKSHMLMGNYDESLKIAAKAMVLHEEGSNREGIAATLLVMGNCYLDQAKFELGIDVAKQASDIAIEIGNETYKAKSLNLLGSIYKYKGDHERALESYLQAMSIYDRLGRRSLLADVILNVGSVYAELGDAARSLEYYSKSGALFDEIGDQYGIAVNSNNMGVSYYRQGDYGKARESFQRYYEISVKTGAKDGQALGLSNVAYTSMELGNYEDALENYRKALRIAQETGDKLAMVSALSGTAACYENQDKYLTAFEYYQKAYQLAVQSEYKMMEANSLMMMGVTNWKAGKTDAVLENLDKSANIFQTIGSQYLLAENFFWIGSVQYSKGNMAASEDALLKSIEIANEIGYVYNLPPALHKLALLYRDSGRKEEAVQKLTEAVHAIERSRKELRLAEQRMGFFQSKVDVYDDLVLLLVSLNRNDEAFEYVQRSKARGFVDMLAEAQIDPEKYLSSELRDKKKQLISEMMILHNRIEQETERENTDKAKLRELVRNRNDLQNSHTNLVLEIRKQNTEYAELQYPKPLTLSEAQTLLDGDTVLLEYYVRKSSALLFVVSKTDGQVFDLSKAKNLRDQISSFRETLLKPDQAYDTIHQTYAKYTQLSQDLYNELIAPAQNLIKNKHLVLAPDGPLNYLPFESLLTKKTATGAINFASLPYLAREHEMSYISSISVLSSVLHRQKPKSEGAPKQLLAFADPKLKTETGTITEARGISNIPSASTLAPLKYARTEVAEIASLYPTKDVTVLIGPYASERKLKQMDLQNYRALHFASHAMIDEQNPEFSALILSPDEKGTEDGFLTMREVFDLKLNADLVVLSACKTGLGKDFSGEGLAGISRAFLLAGTPSVVVSLWDVYDRSTADLMAAFYKSLKNGNTNKAAAMKQARMELIRSGKFSHPYYWSPFILIGSN